LIRFAVVALALLALGGSAAAAPAHARTCGQIARIGEAGTELVTVHATRVRCAVARRVLERHTRGKASTGWKCSSAGSEAVCTRGRKRASYGPASSHGCSPVAFQPNSDDGAGGIRARRVSCKKARAVARGSEPFGPSNPGSYRKLGFDCTAHALDAALPTALYTCRNGRATVAFERT
jgi:hypothetical protein